jgi:hypothetical protein
MRIKKIVRMIASLLKRRRTAMTQTLKDWKISR